LKYFRLPTIFLSAVNSVASVGLVNYVKQEHVSLITCLISLTTGIITSIELYLGLEKSMNNELEKNRDFYLLGIDIYKTLQLKRENRNVDGSTYLEQCISMYSKLYENSNVLVKNIKDQLTVIEMKPGNRILDDEEADNHAFSLKKELSKNVPQLTDLNNSVDENDEEKDKDEKDEEKNDANEENENIAIV
jgi:hypothetical protein